MKNLEQLKEKEIEKSVLDFSKWIGRYNTTLTIKGDKFLQSFDNGGIGYSNGFKDSYTCDIHYKHTTLDKLEKGDVFICECDLIHIGLHFFYIYIGKGSYNYVFQNLGKCGGIERIDFQFSENGKKKVIKFLRN